KYQARRFSAMLPSEIYPLAVGSTSPLSQRETVIAVTPSRPASSVWVKRKSQRSSAMHLAHSTPESPRRPTMETYSVRKLAQNMTAQIYHKVASGFVSALPSFAPPLLLFSCLTFRL